MYYNYIYLDPRKRGQYTYEGLNFSLLYEPFYVGKGKDKRKFAHLQEYRWLKYDNNRLKINKIKKIISNNYDCSDFIITINHTDDELYVKNYEIYLISLMGRLDLKTGTLTNLSDGGDGNNPSSETRDKQSKAKIGRSYIDRLGLEQSIITKKKKSDICMGELNHFYGKTHSDKTKEKISQNRKGKLSGDEHWMKVQGRTFDEETRNRMSESHKKLIGEKANKLTYYKIISPEQIIYYVAGSFLKFCSDNGIKSPQFLREVSKGLREDYKGWKCFKLTKEDFYFQKG